MELRPYQVEFIDGLAEAIKTARAVLGVASTGAGKTVVFDSIAERAMRKGKRITIVAHRDNIVDQISEGLAECGVRHGRIQPGRTSTDDPVQVGMVQTVANRLVRLTAPDLLIVDEAHHTPAGSFQRCITGWPRARVLGFTATPERLDGRGLGDTFQAMVEAPPMRALIDAGFLADYEYLAPPQKADLSNVATKAGDYVVSQLEAVMDTSSITGDAVSHYIKHFAGRPAIAYCVTIGHAEHVAETFRAAGYRAAAVHGKLHPRDIRDLIAAIGDGRLNILTSCELISEGTNVPTVQGVVMLRPTKSLTVFLQQYGRSARPKPDGSRAIVLDHVGNVHQHGLPDRPREWSLAGSRRREKEASVKTCEKCYRAFATGPGWREAEVCTNGQPVGCILNVADRAPSERALPQQVDGELQRIEAAARAAAEADAAIERERLADIVTAKLRDSLTGHETWEELEVIRKARGYAPGWVFHVMKGRRQQPVKTQAQIAAEAEKQRRTAVALARALPARIVDQVLTDLRAGYPVDEIATVQMLANDVVEVLAEEIRDEFERAAAINAKNSAAAGVDA